MSSLLRWWRTWRLDREYRAFARWAAKRNGISVEEQEWRWMGNDPDPRKNELIAFPVAR